MLKDLSELVSAGIITEETAENIRVYYEKKGTGSGNRLFLVFGILGALLVGTGIILILAHNWDQFSTLTKTVLVFIPLLVGQLCCGFTMFLPRLKGNATWQESSATFLFFAVGACISMIGQIYNIPGSMESYLLSWMLLCLPLVYIMPSSMVSLLYLAGITAYGVHADYFSANYYPHHLYWLLLAFVLPSFYRHVQQKPFSNFTLFHHWMLPASILVMIGSLAQSEDEWRVVMVTYAMVFGLLYTTGRSAFLQHLKPASNSYVFIGFSGIIILCFIGAYHDFWDVWDEKKSPEISPVWIPLTISLLISGYLIYRNNTEKTAYKDLIQWGFAAFGLAALIGPPYPVAAAVLMNMYLLATGIQLIFRGTQELHIGLLNVGLLMLSVLIMMRFFDIDMSYVLRGVLFVLLGAAFFLANYLMLRQRKKHE